MAKKAKKTVAKKVAKGNKAKANKTSFKRGHAPLPGGGRPLGSDEYKPEYDAKIIALGQEGMTRTQMAVALGVIRETLTGWAKKHPTFSAAFKRALQHSQATWEVKGFRGCEKGHGFNGATYQFLMRNIFKDEYADTQNHKHEGEGFREFLQAMSGGKFKPRDYDPKEDDAI